MSIFSEVTHSGLFNVYLLVLPPLSLSEQVHLFFFEATCGICCITEDKLFPLKGQQSLPPPLQPLMDQDRQGYICKYSLSGRQPGGAECAAMKRLSQALPHRSQLLSNQQQKGGRYSEFNNCCLI